MRRRGPLWRRAEGSAYGTMEGMDNIQDQIRELQTSVRRQRFAIVALASALTGIAFVGAVSPAGDATFDTITCKAWKVVDKDGRARIGADALPNGAASIAWVDKDGKPRIGAYTLPDGRAGMTWFDKDGKERISAATESDGLAGVALRDKYGKDRINATTDPDSWAKMAWYDKAGTIRIGAVTRPDGTVILPTTDLK